VKSRTKVEVAIGSRSFEELPEQGGKKVHLELRWSEPVDENCDLVDAAIQIIEPAEGKKSQCRRFVADTIRLMRMIPTHGAAPSRKLRKLMEACRRVTALLAELPQSLSDGLLPDELNESDLTDEIREGVPAPMRFRKNPKNTSRSRKLRMELEFLVKAIDMSYLRKKRGRQKNDLVKLNAVMGAYHTLIQYSSFAPTTTAGGPFYELSSIFYEAVTGLAGVSMERQCRKFLKSELAQLTN
jgi:hypothetical protein